MTPLGGPAVTGSAVTLHGSGLRDYGGFLPGGGVRCKFSFAEITVRARATAAYDAAYANPTQGHTPAAASAAALASATAEGFAWAHETRGSQLDEGRVQCATPPVAVTWMALGETIGAYLSVALTLNGDILRTATGAVCAPVGNAMRCSWLGQRAFAHSPCGEPATPNPKPAWAREESPRRVDAKPRLRWRSAANPTSPMPLPLTMQALVLRCVRRARDQGWLHLSDGRASARRYDIPTPNPLSPTLNHPP